MPSFSHCERSPSEPLNHLVKYYLSPVVWEMPSQPSCLPAHSIRCEWMPSSREPSAALSQCQQPLRQRLSAWSVPSLWYPRPSPLGGNALEPYALRKAVLPNHQWLSPCSQNQGIFLRTSSRCLPPFAHQVTRCREKKPNVARLSPCLDTLYFAR